MQADPHSGCASYEARACPPVPSLLGGRRLQRRRASRMNHRRIRTGGDAPAPACGWDEGCEAAFLLLSKATSEHHQVRTCKDWGGRRSGSPGSHQLDPIAILLLLHLDAGDGAKLFHQGAVSPLCAASINLLFFLIESYAWSDKL